MSTATLTREKFKDAEKKDVEGLEDGDERRALLGSRKPPKQGPCKRCGKGRPLNRLFLCYSCWVKTRLEENGWREGMPHPPECGCSLDCKIEKQGGQN